MERQAAVHVPVLCSELLHWLKPRDKGVYVDATLGLGGHSRAILTASGPDSRVIAFEWDDEALQIAVESLRNFGGRFMAIPQSYIWLQKELLRLEMAQVDGLVADLGVSSLQLDNGMRGFSFRNEAPLDMRMNNKQGRTAADLVAQLSESELADLFYYFGEERQARRIAKFLVLARGKAPISTTIDLADLVAAAVPRKYHPSKVHVATKVFQALRIAVNGELENVGKLLAAAEVVLKPGARIGIITFHSLEDRMVKQAFGSGKFRPLQKKPIVATQEEVNANPRARSAKLRVAERI